jgi:leader peptidase (prepilin peptidase)/N-methyltransferase
VDLSQLFYLVSLFVFGLIFGSFGNVVVWRLPRGESLSHPSSHCPACGHPVRPVDNIPLVSWALLRGRCRDCGEPISVRYPVVELLSGCLWLLAGIVYGMTAQAAVAVALFYLLLLLGAIDLDTMRLPNPLVALVAVVGLLAAVASQLTGVAAAPLVPLAASGWLSVPLPSAIAGALIGAGITGLIGVAYGAVRGKAGMGMGDYKLLAAAGLYLGPYVLVALLFGSAASLAVILPLQARGGRKAMARKFPFGPFLAFGIVAAAVAGPAAVAWYLSLLGGS